MLKRIISVLFCYTLITSATQASTLQNEMDGLIRETQAVLPMLDDWQASDVKTQFLHRLNENLLLLKLAKEMDSGAVSTDHDEAFYAEVTSLLDYQIGLLYVTYQVLDFARTQRIPFDLVLKRFPPLKVDLKKALNRPIKIEYAKVLFDRWLYLGLVSRY